MPTIEGSRLREIASQLLVAAGAGDEEAIRALYAGDLRGFTGAMDGWPDDLRDHALTLAGAGPQNA